MEARKYSKEYMKSLQYKIHLQDKPGNKMKKYNQVMLYYALLEAMLKPLYEASDILDTPTLRSRKNPRGWATIKNKRIGQLLFVKKIRSQLEDVRSNLELQEEDTDLPLRKLTEAIVETNKLITLLAVCLNKHGITVPVDSN